MRGIISRLTLVLVCLIFLTGTIIAAESKEELKIKIESINDMVNKAQIEQDFETILKYYTDDVICMPNFNEMFQGIEAMREDLEKIRDSGFKFHSFNTTILDVWSCGDLVYEMGTYGWSGSTPEMPRPIAENGKYFAIWEKQSDGSYKVNFTIWNTDINIWGE